MEGDYVMVPTYTVASSIDYLLRYAREARWDIVGRAMQVLEAGFVKKMNDDGWHTLLAAGVDCNILVYDGDAANGQFTKRLISLLKTITRVFGVNLHDLDELGAGQEYQTFYTDQLSGTLQGSDSELIVGLDLNKNDSFVMPVKQEVQIFEDDALHRHQRAGFYGWAELGFAVLDNRRILLGSF